MFFQIKEGAENLRKVAKDKKSVSDVNIIVKKSNSKLTELQHELHELESQILVSQGHTLNTSLSGEKLNQNLVKVWSFYCNIEVVKITVKAAKV
jgi:hypothetical protein